MDAFSQWLDHDTKALDNENIVVLGLELTANAANILSLEQQVFTIQDEHMEQIEGLWKEYPLDKIEGKWFYHGHPIVPNNKEVKQGILKWYHDHPLARHLRIANTTITMMCEYWWLEVQQFATAYVCRCVIC